MSGTVAICTLYSASGQSISVTRFQLAPPFTLTYRPSHNTALLWGSTCDEVVSLVITARSLSIPGAQSAKASEYTAEFVGSPGASDILRRSFIHKSSVRLKASCEFGVCVKSHPIQLDDSPAPNTIMREYRVGSLNGTKVRSNIITGLNPANDCVRSPFVLATASLGVPVGPPYVFFASIDGYSRNGCGIG
jgi:hypothetical protein